MIKQSLVSKDLLNGKGVMTPKFIDPSKSVCPFDLSKELNMLGIKLKTFFYYLHFHDTGKRFLYRNKTAFKTFQFNLDREASCELIPAPLSGELGKHLPEECRTLWRFLANGKKYKQWCCQYVHQGNEILANGKTEVEARAKLLIQLKQKE